MMFRKFSMFLMVVLSYAPFATSAEAQDTGKRYLFVGNPGSGKSTLINSIIGREVCKAGLSEDGKGLTKDFEIHRSQGHIFIDTPGLADISSRAEAAKEIEKALKQGGIYHIFFVLKLDGLRVRPDDVASLNLIMDAVDHDRKVFSVIINNLIKKEMNAILKPDSNRLLEIKTRINSGLYKADTLILLPNDTDIDDDLKTMIDLSQQKDNLLNNTPSMGIAKDRVKAIQLDKFEVYKKESDRKMEEFARKLKEQDEELLKSAAELEETKQKLREAQESGFWDSFWNVTGFVVIVLAHGVEVAL